MTRKAGVGLHVQCLSLLSDFNQKQKIQILVKLLSITIHENKSSRFPFITYVWTDRHGEGNKCIFEDLVATLPEILTSITSQLCFLYFIM
jgi:hypothetical protein